MPIMQCDEFGFRHNALVPMTHSLEAPGGPLKYCLDGHDFAVFGCSLTTDQRYVISTSTRELSCIMAFSTIYRVTIQADSNLPLTSKQKLRFSMRPM